MFSPTLISFIIAEVGKGGRINLLLEACAKINWSLDITGVREDGYHLMDMLMQPVSLADTIRLLPAEELSLTTGGFPRIRPDENHLALRAARLLKEYTGCTLGAAISVHKRIPVCAGMGGGSADAAAVLFGLNRLWHTDLSPAELEKLGVKLGADIPFCLRGGLTRTRGIGDLMENLPFSPVYPLIVVQPCRGLSTRDVFSAWKESGETRHPDTENAMKAMENGDLSLLRKSLGNVLQPVSERMRPQIALALRKLRETGADAALMTGSGSAVFGVFRNASRARAAFPTVSSLWRSTFLCHTQHDSIRLTEEEDAST